MEIQKIVEQIKPYFGKGKDSFSHNTNIDIYKRFVVFDLSKLDNKMQKLGRISVLNLLHIYEKL